MNRAHGAVESVYHAPRSRASRRRLDTQKSNAPNRRFPEGVKSLGLLAGRIGLVLALVAGPSAAIAHRDRIVAAAPELARAYAAIGLSVHNGFVIEDLHVRLAMVGDRKMLTLDAMVINPRNFGGAVPNLRIVLRGADGREIYGWTTHPPKDRLEASERARFAAKLEAPPEGAVEAIVSFVDGGAPSTR